MAFFVILLFGLIFTICGVLIKIKPPSKKSIYAYKTPFSLKNNDTWSEGNRIASNLMLLLGPFYLVLSLLNNSINLNTSSMIYPLIILPAMLLMAIPNMYLRFKFDENGFPKK
ncbi:SdpI family protein [[Clostridium] dakarense]|uniref:SdpI family protein n=1 Tax=Faecalimicrobium dakarense TaxID=1301100 RepID=UPI0004B3FC54|nr:SdpI family protein [[Clostridium] dakarense]